MKIKYAPPAAAALRAALFASFGAVFFAAGAGANEVTVASWGGSYQEAQSKALFKPVEKALGITIHEETYKGIGQVRTKVAANAVSWDIISTGSGGGARGCVEKILEPLDFDIIDVTSFVPDTYLPCCVGSDVFATVMAWNTETYGDKGPQSWADFWDVKKFPGTRSIRGKMHGMLEPALMADGVPPGRVYEVLDSRRGIERALDKIRELKPHVAVWWGSGAQHAQLMKDGEVDMTTGWNGRFDVAIKDGAKTAYTYNQGLQDYDCFGIPKGAPNKDLAMRVISAMSRAKFQVNLPKYITYGPTNSDVYKTGKISPAVARKLPSHPDNARKLLPVSQEWYAKWEKIASEMYQDMITE
ncbi:MAG: ABC transporter substrate-binding protein [Gammaproteobacteria bacterium]|nr:ABC transporter substrate-binding protein [Gammaproteobacteria bacterium]MDA8010834.1 ABC transporter substrate-binding protein [Gammaproteobacteria bacterium]MDA8021463.1 ABC transporter substrate-binding protein [Gammaproteobacteria bacterium]